VLLRACGFAMLLTAPLWVAVMALLCWLIK
jgi:hypothetical protein